MEEKKNIYIKTIFELSKTNFLCDNFKALFILYFLVLENTNKRKKYTKLDKKKT